MIPDRLRQQRAPGNETPREPFLIVGSNKEVIPRVFPISLMRPGAVAAALPFAAAPLQAQPFSDGRAWSAPDAELAGVPARADGALTLRAAGVEGAGGSSA